VERLYSDQGACIGHVIRVLHATTLRLIRPTIITSTTISSRTSISRPLRSSAAGYQGGRQVGHLHTFNRISTIPDIGVGAQSTLGGRAFLPENYVWTRNILDSDQVHSSSLTVFPHIPNEFGQTGNSAIRSDDLENPTVEPNMKWIGWPIAEINYGHLKFSQMWGRWSLVGRSPVGRWSVLNIYFFLHCSHILLFAMLRA